MFHSLLKLPAGVRCAGPVMLFLLAGFVAPLVMVVGYAFATPNSFDVFSSFSLANFATALAPPARYAPHSSGRSAWHWPAPCCWH